MHICLSLVVAFLSVILAKSSGGSGGPTSYLALNQYNGPSCGGWPVSVDYKPLDYCYPNPNGADFMINSLNVTAPGIFTLSTFRYLSETCETPINIYPDSSIFGQSCMSNSASSSSIPKVTSTITTTNYFTTLAYTEKGCKSDSSFPVIANSFLRDTCISSGSNSSAMYTCNGVDALAMYTVFSDSNCAVSGTVTSPKLEQCTQPITSSPLLFFSNVCPDSGV